jgi:hypothetical protein
MAIGCFLKLLWLQSKLPLLLYIQTNSIQVISYNKNRN